MMNTKENTTTPVMSIEDISISYGDDKYAVKHANTQQCVAPQRGHC
jgi:hypothetical protein